MKIKNYPYGKPSKSLKKAADYLNKNYVKIINEYINDEYNKYRHNLYYLIMDDPEYFGVPKIVANRLNTDEIDWLQEEFENLKFRYKDSIRAKFNPIAKKYVTEAKKLSNKIDKIMPFVMAAN